MYHFYNLDTRVEEYFDNARVINILKKNEINDLFSLYAGDINKIVNSNACGSKSRDIIEEAFYTLKSLANKKEDLSLIKLKYVYLMNETIVVSLNSDNNDFRTGITFENLIDLYEKNNLSEKDFINANMIFSFLEIFSGDNPLDYISPSTAKFSSYKEAYNYLIQIIDGMNNEKAKIFKRYNGIFEKKCTLEEIGKDYGLTRERIRQINKKTTERIYKQFDSIERKIINTFNRNYYIPFSNPLLKIYCEYLVNKKVYKQESIFDEYVIVKDDYLLTKVEQIKNEIELNNCYEEKIDNSILRLFEKKYIIKDNKILNNATLNNFVPTVLRKLGRSVNLNSDNDVRLIYEILENEYNVFTEYKDARNLERVLSDTAVLVDSKTFIAEEYQKRTDMSDVFEYIDNHKVTNAQTLYSVFTNKWNSIDIYSHVGTYGYLKYFYPNKYNYAGRSFVINVLGESTSWGEIVENMIYERKEPVRFNMVHELYPALNNMIWINLEANFTDLVMWGDNSYYCPSLLDISAEDINFITIYIFNKKIVSDKELYTYLLQNRKWILDNNFLHSERQLLKFIRLKLGDVIHYNPESNIYYI